MIRRLITEAIEGVAGLPVEGPPRTDLRDAARATPMRRPLPAPADEESVDLRPRREPAPLAPVPQARGVALGLGSRAELRRAFLLMEVLGPPVSLRDGRGSRGRE